MDIVVKQEDGSTAPMPTMRGNLMPASAMAATGAGAGSSSSGAADAAGDTASGSAEDRMMDLSASSKAAQEKHAGVLLRMEAAKLARTLPVATDDGEVRTHLRTLGQPVTLFGEGPGDRRDRLRGLLAEIQINRAVAAGTFTPSVGTVGANSAMLQGGAVAALAALGPGLTSAAAAAASAAAAAMGLPTQTELFYTPASEELQSARASIAAYSFERASKRLRAAAEVAASPAACRAEDAHAARLYGALKRARPLISQAGDDRPITSCALSHDASMLATAGWSGVVKVWTTDGLQEIGTLRGHRDRVVGVAWHPAAGMLHGGGSDAAGSGSAAVHGTHHAGGQADRHLEGARGMLASCSVDGTAKLWRVPAPLLEAARARAARAAAASGSGSSAFAGGSLSRGSRSSGAKGAGAASHSVPSTTLRLRGGEGAGSAAMAADDASDDEEDGDAAGSAASGAGAGAGAPGMDVDGASSSSSSHPAASGLSGHAGSSAGGGDDADHVSPIGTFAGHTARLASVAFHPCGRYVGTASYDRTWRLWDVETQRELLVQEGHGREVYALAFQRDGSLAATGDLGGTGRVWDLRTGKSVMTLKGHAKQLLALDFSPNGHHVASGSDDNTSIIWELRQQRDLYTIPAHRSLIKAVRYAPVSGEYLLTASYDGTIKAWCGRDFSPLATLAGHDNKVTAVDIAAAPIGRHGPLSSSADSSSGGAGGSGGEGLMAPRSLAESTVVSVSFDRTIKLWAPGE